MLKVLRQRNFALLWFGQMVSVAGDWVLGITLPFYVFKLTGSALATGAMYIASALPPVLIGSVAGVFVDRWDRRRTMIAADLLRAAALLILLLVRSPRDLWLIYIPVLLMTAFSQFFGPAENALLPGLVDRSQLVEANSLNSVGRNVAHLVAPPLGGLLFAWFGLHSVVLFDSASFLFSALLIALIVVPRQTAPEAQPVPSAARGWGPFWREWTSGLRIVRREPLISSLFLVLGIAMISEGIIEVLLVPWIRQWLEGDTVLLGTLMSAQAVGSLLGGGAIGWLGKKVAPAHLLIAGLFGWGALDLVIFNVRSVPLILGTFVLVGFPVAALFVSVNVLVQAGVADEYRGRVFGAYGTTSSLMMMLGYVVGSGLGDATGARPLLTAACVLLIVATGVALLRLPRAVVARPAADVGG